MTNKKFHINPENGEPGECIAINKCKYGKSTPHFLNKEEARIYFERSQSPETIVSLSKNNKKDEVIKLSESELEDSITKYLKDYSKKWHPTISKIKTEHPEFGYGSSDLIRQNLSNHIINFLAYNQGKAVTREQLNKISEKIIKNNPTIKKSSDVIQLVNKSDQKGLKRKKYKNKGEYLYGFSSLEFDDARLKARVDTSTKLENTKKEIDFKNNIDKTIVSLEKYIQLLKKWKEKDFQKGHIHPDRPLTDDNLVMQPASFNQSYKDNYKFQNDGFQILCPTTKNLKLHPEKFYTPEEWVVIKEIAIEQTKKNPE